MDISDIIQFLDKIDNKIIIDIIKIRSLRNSAKLFYSLFPYKFIYNKNKKIWYEKNNNIYSISNTKLENYIDNNFCKLFDALIIKIDENGIKIKKNNDDNHVKLDNIKEIENTIIMIEKFIIFIKQDTTIKKLIVILKEYYVVNLPQEIFTLVENTSCYMEQWIYLNIIKEVNKKSKYTCNELYNKFLTSKPFSSNIIAFGKKLNKIIGTNKKSGNNRYYYNIKLLQMPESFLDNTIHL